MGPGEGCVSFRYQKRINLGKGAGLNVSQSGISASYRTKMGSIGTKGFSIKTGIPGLTYRGSFGRSKNAGLILLIYIVIVFVVLVIYNLLAFLGYVASLAFAAARNAWLNRSKEKTHV
jgi:uncharacterized membrane protein